MTPSTPPKRLARPLAARVGGLPPANDWPAESELEPSAVLDAAIDALHRGETHYTDRPGILPLRELAAASLRSRYNIDVTPKEVTITCGATEARYVTVKLLAKAGSQVYCPGPALIRGAVHIVGAEVTNVPTDNVSLAYLTPDDDPAVIGAALAQAAERGWYILWDLAAASHVGRARAFHPAQLNGLVARTVTVESASDRIPGWRVGWMAGSEVAEKLRSLKQAMTICTTSYAQWAAVEAVKPA